MRFKTNAHLKDVLGRELINDDNIAIAELVKNSYDAEATEVIIEFIEGDGFSRIVITDNGKGMSKEDLEGKWLNIAYSSKKDANTASRVLAGAKGIGRFSCDRLGSKLTLYTKKSNATDVQKLAIDWTDFEGDNQGLVNIEDVNLSFRRVDKDYVQKDIGHSLSRSGTILVIDEVRDYWERKKILNLRRQLSRIINPNEEFSAEKFDILIVAAHFLVDDENAQVGAKVNGKVDNQIFEKLKFETTYVESSIDGKGDFLSTSIFSRGQLVIGIKEKNPFPLLANIKMRVHYLNPIAKIFFTRTTGYRVTEFGSVFLFVNGFRVSPYGDVANDWLGLDKRKQQGHSRYLGSREVVGRIDVLDRNSDFRQVSSREGLVRNASYNEAFLSMQEGVDQNSTSFFLKAFKRLEKFVVDGLGWDRASSPVGGKAQPYLNLLERALENGEMQIDDIQSKASWAMSESEKRKNIASSLISILDSKKDELVDLFVEPKVIGEIVSAEIKDQDRILNGLDEYKGSVSSKKVKAVIANLRTGLEEARAQVKRAESEIDSKDDKIEKLEQAVQKKTEQVYFHESTKNYSNQQLLHLHHQIAILSMSFASQLDTLRKRLVKKDQYTSDISGVLAKMYYLTNRISVVTQYATVSNLKERSAKEERNLPIFISEYVSTLNDNKLLAGNGGALALSVVNHVPRWLSEVVPIEICMVFDNLFSNAIRAKATKVTVSVMQDGNDLVIQVENNGNDIPEKEISFIFDEGYTTTLGSGMGMTHIRNILKRHSGELKLVSSAPVSFEVRFFK